MARDLKCWRLTPSLWALCFLHSRPPRPYEPQNPVQVPRTCSTPLIGLSVCTLGGLVLYQWLTCPTNTVAPILGHPAPLSVNSVKTAAALCLVGVMTHRQTITGTKAKKWTLQKIPSARGRCFAQKMLKDATAITATQVRRVPCQRSGVYVASLITTSACTRPPTMKESTAMIESHEIVASHP